MTRKTAFLSDLAGTLPALCQALIDNGVKTLKAQNMNGLDTRDNLLVAIDKALSAFVATELTDEDRKAAEDAQAAIAKLQAKHNAHIVKLDTEADKRASGLNAKEGFAAMASKLAEIDSWLSAEKSKAAASLDSDSAPHKETLARVQDVKGTAAKAEFMRVTDGVDKGATIASTGNGTSRIDLSGTWQFKPYNEMGTLIYTHDEEPAACKWYYLPEGMTVGSMLPSHKVGSRSEGVKVAALFWSKREQHPKDAAARFDAAKNGPFTTTLGVGHKDDTHPYGSLVSKLDKLPAWAEECKARAEKVQK